MLVVTQRCGLLGGIIGLILAVPAAVIAGNAIAAYDREASSSGLPNAPRPHVQRMLD